MEQPIVRLKRLSAELVSRLGECELEDFDQYMTEREEIFENLMQGQLKPEEHEDAKRILELDKQIIIRMLQLKNEAAEELEKVQQGQRSRNLYDSSYGAHQDESLFFDRRR
ncbi:hypothetical protein [Paenibacillus xanthanilyticus]|uniref:Flagellar protein FliT n=1 Tax=Paenibacillus xanthanilyticus TaxID=1783531 RepID=A0ABV8K7N0_9BACL